ncbi:MAG: hypothetical protein ABEJ02_01185 [Candidatus Paceibacteria bacterium]
MSTSHLEATRRNNKQAHVSGARNDLTFYETTVGTHMYKYLRRKSTARRKSWQGRSSSTVGSVIRIKCR